MEASLAEGDLKKQADSSLQSFSTSLLYNLIIPANEGTTASGQWNIFEFYALFEFFYNLNQFLSFYILIYLNKTFY
jgi:hypothetical protein